MFQYGQKLIMPKCAGLVAKRQLPCIHDLCARVQNGYVAKLKNISIPETKMNLNVAQILYQQGFISSVSRGNHIGIDYSMTTPENIATRRYWLSLKYRNNNPVLSKMSAVSKPSRKIFATVDEFKTIVGGGRAGMLGPLQPGEIIIVNTPLGVYEIHEAISLNQGGYVLCRAH
jgi:small subunit ribosomal protein S8